MAKMDDIAIKFLTQKIPEAWQKLIKTRKRERFTIVETTTSNDEAKKMFPHLDPDKP